MKGHFKTAWCYICLALLTAAGQCVAAQPERAATGSQEGLSLSEAIRSALENNPGLQASGARVEAASGRAYQAKKWTNPDLELSAEDWPLSEGRGFSDAKQTIGIAQTLPYPGKKSLDSRIGTAGVKLSETELALRRTELVRDVKAAYYRVVASERLLRVSKELVSVSESSSDTARKRVDAGAAAYQEQLRAEVQLEQTRSELANAERDLETARAIFANLTGLTEARTARLSSSLVETAKAELLASNPEAFLEAHPSAVAARANLERADLERRRARLEPYPDVRVGLAGGRIGQSDESIIELGLSLPLPILDRGKGKQQEAGANLKVAEAELASVKQHLQREWVSAQKRYRTAMEQVANYRERLLPKAEEALSLVQTGFEEGKFGFIDLVDTQRTTAEARLAYQQKVLEMNVAQAELEALVQPESSQSSTTK